jgi:hypothetical protein
MGAMSDVTPKKKYAKWQDEFLFDIYDLASEGLNNKEIAKVLNVRPLLLKQWSMTKPLVKYALIKARKFREKAASNTLDGWFFDSLTKEQRELWSKVNILESHPSGVERLQALFAKHGKQARQNLFLYALLHSNFSSQFACRKVGISQGMLQKWIDTDLDFVKCLDMVHTRKKEFFESRLIEKVVDGDTSAIMFANRTQNRTPGFLHDGYADKLEVAVQGSIDHRHLHTHKIDLTDLDLPLETRKVILDAVRAKKLKEEIVEPQPQLALSRG